MRRVIRPFVKEFKKRRSESSKQPNGETEKAAFEQPLPDPDRSISQSNESRTAMEAADALFGRTASATLVSPEASASNAYVGRILPSLVVEEHAPAPRPAAPAKKPRSSGKTRISETFSPPKPQTPSLRPKREPVRIERPAVNPSPDLLTAEETSRERRSIQKRWVLKTALKPGQKWKRRLRGATS